MSARVPVGDSWKARRFSRVEVRSEADYSPAAEREMAAKRQDYFAAGTLVVWDVDVLRSESVRVFRASDPLNPAVYTRGQLAEAEPAVPGWTFPRRRPVSLRWGVQQSTFSLQLANHARRCTSIPAR
jgi:Putative restriction endonuclease